MENNSDQYTREEALKEILLMEKRKKQKNLISWITSAIISIIIAVIFSSILSIFSDFFSKDKKLKDNKSIQIKINELDNVKSSLLNLNTFIEEQKTIIIEQQKIIDKLQEKNNELEPIVNSNQKTVDAIIKESERKTKKNIWKERFIGIIMGIISSLIAGFLWKILTKSK
jgi:sensor c-di-GMP phosphodiesterase-like protein